VKDYLGEMLKVSLPTAEEEVSLAERIEVGVFAQDKLDTAADVTDELHRDLEW